MGQIGYFQGGCPEGWYEFKRGAFRMLIGEGSTTDTNGEARVCKLDETGGTFSHKLEISEIPSHRHLYTAYGRAGTYATETSTFDSSWGDVWHEARSLTSSITGGGMSHNNMPPYIIYSACKKGYDYSFDSSDLILNADLKNYLLKNNLNQLKSSLDIFKLEYEKKTTLSRYEELLTKNSIAWLSGYAKKDELSNYFQSSNNRFPALKEKLSAIEKDYAKKADYEFTNQMVLPSELPNPSLYVTKKELLNYFNNIELEKAVADLTYIQSEYLDKKNLSKLNDFAEEKDIKFFEDVIPLGALKRYVSIEEFKNNLVELALLKETRAKKSDIPSMYKYVKKEDLAFSKDLASAADMEKLLKRNEDSLEGFDQIKLETDKLIETFENPLYGVKENVKEIQENIKKMKEKLDSDDFLDKEEFAAAFVSLHELDKLFESITVVEYPSSWENSDYINLSVLIVSSLQIIFWIIFGLFRLKNRY